MNAMQDNESSFRIGETLREEIVACLLGGHGVSGELSNAAFHHLKRTGILNEKPASQSRIEAALRAPLKFGDRSIRYRYPKQKARFISASLFIFDSATYIPLEPQELRGWLTTMPGIGLKTASWIVRNWLGADCVAILDIHIHRAGVIMGLFSPKDDIGTSYLDMEARFVALAEALGIAASTLDNQIWSELRRVPATVRTRLKNLGITENDRCGLPPRKSKSRRSVSEKAQLSLVD